MFNAKDDGEKKTPLLFSQHDKENLKVQIVKFTVKTSQSNFSGRKKPFLSNICICWKSIAYKKSKHKEVL